MKTSVIRRLVLPPKWGETRPEDEVRARAQARIGAIVSATLFDMGILLALKDVASIRKSAPYAFGVINPSLLALDVALTLIFLRKVGRSFAWVLSVCAVLEVITALIWVQLTGSLSSYF